MQPKDDWILTNLRNIIEHKHFKVENIANAIGISAGELSKILNGERQKYYKHLPAICDFIGVEFHELVKNENHLIQNNSNQKGGTAINKSEGIDKIIVDKMISQYENNINALKDTIKAKDEIIIAKDEVIKVEREAKENYKRKYENCKEIRQTLENELNQKP